MLRRCFLPLLMAVALAAAVAGSDAGLWWSHVQFLADDKLQGRETGSEGYRQAAAYVAGEFERAGLKPAGSEGYFQAVSFRSRSIVEEQSRLALVRQGKVEPLTLGEDAYFSLRIDPAETLEAPIMFVGYGLSVPERKHDDLAGLELRGKVVMFLSGGPESIPGPLRAHHQAAGERWKALRRAGALGTLLVQNPRSMDIPWARATLARFQPSMSLADPALDETAGQKLAAVVNPDRAEKFFAGSGYGFQQLLELANAGKALPRFPLPVAVRAKVRVQRSELESHNVLAVLPGADPRLRDEYVVLSAHLDHVGVGRPIGGDSIHNGAMDNAAGVATLLEVAASLRESKTGLRRSLLFLVVTGEEKGLLGSKYFVAYPTVKPESIVANLNVDMFLPIFPLRILTAYGLDESDLGAQLRAVAGPLGLRVQADPEPNRNAFIRSDQYSFIRRGVPALAFKNGYEKDSAEAALFKKWLTERYHAPADDVLQPVDLAAAANFNKVMLRLVEAVANRPERPRWNPGSFFRRYAP